MNENKQKLLEAEFYEKELQENQRSIDALIAILEHQREEHPQYKQLHYLEERNKEINSQLASLKEIIDNLKEIIDNLKNKS